MYLIFDIITPFPGSVFTMDLFLFDLSFCLVKAPADFS